MIHKNIIIGSGFSAYITYLFLKKKALIISNESKMINNRHRRNNLEINTDYIKRSTNSKIFKYNLLYFKIL